MKIQQQVCLKPYNSFGVAAHAAYFTQIHKTPDLIAALDFCQQQNLSFLCLGGGSNVLFLNDYAGCILRMGNKGIQQLQQDAEYIWIAAAAGENWHTFVQYTLKQGAFGLENLSLIPGTVGAAPVQNIGAYGVEVGQRIEAVEVWDRQKQQLCTLQAEECLFGYRSSLFKQHPGRYIILQVIFRLLRQADLRLEYGNLGAVLKEIPQPNPLQVAAAVCRLRQQKLPDPDLLGNAGSFFKNPEVSQEKAQTLQQQWSDLVMYPLGFDRVKLAAGQLIDKAGWRGKRIENAGMYAQQALVLVNYGGASGKSLWHVAQQVQQSVLEQTGIRLEPEPLILE